VLWHSLIVSIADPALKKVPINPQDVLDPLPDAASMISDHGGVPISVTLQPIPAKLITGSLAYQLKADFVQDVLKAYSMLDDLGNRFRVLQDEATRVRDFVPDLERTCRASPPEHTRKHIALCFTNWDNFYTTTNTESSTRRIAKRAVN